MYPTSQKWKENIYKNVQCAMNIYIDDILINPDYILEFKKGGELFDEELTLGSVSSQYIEMKLYKDNVPEKPSRVKIEYGILINNALTVEEVDKMLVGTLHGIQIKSLSSNDSSFEMIPIGIYNIDDYTDNDDDTITIKALDNMIKFEFNYDGSKLNYPATLITILQDICNKAGVELGSTSFINSEKQISVYDNEITAREYISYIAESAGSFAFIGRDGKLYIRNIYEDETSIPIELFGKYEWGEEYKISKVSFEDGIRNFKIGSNTRNNLWISQDNIFIVDEAQVLNIYNKINGLTVNSFEGQTIIDPAIDIGDKIIIDGKSVIYQGEMTLEGRFITDIKSKIAIKQKEETTVKKESQKTVNRKIKSEINQIDGKITQLVEETTEHSGKLTKVEQDIDSLKQSVEKMEDFKRDIIGKNEIHLTDTAKGLGYVLKLKIKGNTENFKYLAPSEVLTPSEILIPLGRHVTLVCDKQNRQVMSSEAQKIDIILKEPLRNIGEVYDELDIINDEVIVTRRVGVNSDLSLYALDKETTEQLSNIKLKTYENNTYLYLKEYYNLEYEVTYLIKNDYSENFITKVEADSKIEQTADSINLEVNKKLENYSTTEEMTSTINQTAESINIEVRKKVGEKEIISSINHSTESITINADKLNINGTISANGNFKIDTNGNMECKNGKFSGNIYLENGNKIIGGEGIYTNLQFLGSAAGFGNIQSGGFNLLGYYDYYNGSALKTYIDFYIDIPENFTVDKAYITMTHQPVSWKCESMEGEIAIIRGYCRALQIYRADINNRFQGDWVGECEEKELVKNLIDGALNSEWNPSSSEMESRKTNDISSIFTKSGIYRVIIQSTKDVYFSGDDDYTREKKFAEVTGRIFAVMNVYGYMKMS